MAERFVAVDVETANESRASICEIGAALFEGGRLVGTWERLINPQSDFSDFNTAIHGIRAEDVTKAPIIADVLPEIRDFCKDAAYIASYSSFDQQAFAMAGIDLSPIQWIDVMSAVRRTWDEFAYKGYGLGKVALKLGIENKSHHRALNDAVICGKILAEIMALRGFNLSEVDKRNWHTLRYVRKKDGFALKDVPEVFEAGSPNPEGRMFGEVVVFTGENQYPRSEMMRLAYSAGFDVGSGITKKITVLVQGKQDPSKIKGGFSSKQKKALDLIAKGIEIRMISEQDFLDIVKEGGDE